MLPFTWSELSLSQVEKLRAATEVDGATGEPAKLDDLVMYSNGVTMPRDYTTIADRVYNFHCRPDDVWVVTYPKSGTTWMLEMAWMVSHGVDLAAGRATPQTLRCPYIEGFKIGDEFSEKFLRSAGLWPEDPQLQKCLQDPIAFLDSMPGPRIIKTHLPVDFLPPAVGKTCKLIYLARHPNDTLVSYFQFAKSLPTWRFRGGFEDFALYFQGEGLLAYGNQWDHVLKGLARQEDDETLVVWYEEMKRDCRQMVLEVAKLLHSHLTQSQVSELCQYLEFDSLKQNKMVGPLSGLNMHSVQFFRKGKVGDWKNYNLPGMEEFHVKWENICKN